RDDLALFDFEDDGRNKHTRGVLIYVAARAWSRLCHAGPDHRGTKRRRLPRTRRGNFERDLVSLHRWVVGHGAAWCSARYAIRGERAAADSRHSCPRCDQPASARWTLARLSRRVYRSI